MNEKTTVSRSELADLLGMTGQAISDWVNKRVLTKQGDRYPLRENVRAYIYHIKSGGGSNGGLKDEQERLTRIKADREEIKLRKETAELVEGEIVEKVWADMVGNAKAKLLALPTRASGRLPVAPKDLAATKSILEDEVRETLTEIADYDPSKIIEQLIPEDDDEVDATTEAKGQRVGRPKKAAHQRKRSGGRKVENKPD